MKIGFIGCGKMGSALVRGMVEAGFAPGELLAIDAYPAATRDLVQLTGIQAAESNLALAKEADAVVLCVKPADAAAVLREVSDALSGKLLISIAAGVTIQSLRAAAGDRARIVRVMPNTPALIGAGATAYACGEGVTKDDAALVEKVFQAVGTVAAVKEELLDAVTGLSGSGPAYIYLMIEALADGGVRMGLPRSLARQLAAQTAMGAAKMVLGTGLHPAELKDQVTSPGGTTIAGVDALEQHGARAAFISAVKAATERSRELGKA